MWLDLPTLSLRQQILDDFAAHRTPTGAVTMTPKRAKRKTGSERQDAAGSETETASNGTG